MIPLLDPWPRPLDAATSASIKRIALEGNRWWQQEIVEGLGLCPWAMPARREGRARVEVYTDPVPETPRDGLPDSLRALALDILCDESIEVAQMVFPALPLEALAFERWAKAFTIAAHEAAGRASTMAVAAFHPALPWRAAPPLALVPLFRRAPDPTVQWLRLAVLDRVREGRAQGDVWLPTDPIEAARVLAESSRPSVAARVAEANAARATEIGHDVLCEQLAARAQTQALAWQRLGAVPRTV